MKEYIFIINFTNEKKLIFIVLIILLLIFFVLIFNNNLTKYLNKLLLKSNIFIIPFHYE